MNDFAISYTCILHLTYSVYTNSEVKTGQSCQLFRYKEYQVDSNKYNAFWTISSTPFIGNGTDSGGSYDAYLKVKLEKAVAEKAKVIVINGTGGDGDYGLDTVSAGVYRYSADDQVYLINLNVSTANARFQQGMNTIILPRAIALQCQLNDTLYNLQSIGSTPLAGASFFSTDQDSTSASSHVIAVITKNVTATQAEQILTMLTHNSTGARIGNNVTISSSSLYLLHLPNDILSSIPTSVQNAGMGEGPNYLNPLGIISNIAGMAFNFMVWCLTGGVLLLWAHLMIMGLEIIANLTTTAIAVIEEAVDAIVDAFMAFVDWAVEFICDAFDALIAAPLQRIYDGIAGWAAGLTCLMNEAATNIENGASNASASISIFHYIIYSDIFKMLTVIGISLLVVITSVSLMGPFAFIGSLVAPFLIDLMISGMTAAAFAIANVGNVLGWIAGTIWDILGDDLVVGMAGIMRATMGTIGWIASMMSAPVLGEALGFVISSIGAFLSWCGTIVTDWWTTLGFDVIGMTFSLIGTIQIFKNPNPILLKNPTARGILKSLAIGELGISAFELITTVASYE